MFTLFVYFKHCHDFYAKKSYVRYANTTHKPKNSQNNAVIDENWTEKIENKMKWIHQNVDALRDSYMVLKFAQSEKAHQLNIYPTKKSFHRYVCVSEIVANAFLIYIRQAEYIFPFYMILAIFQGLHFELNFASLCMCTVCIHSQSSKLFV